ncbi:MAG TPA: aryl-sulfate sulfotransferase, partial [Pirellulales bacterium]|nr:aryl-sulfate sulfotransferase [Pirellulales bacterium]
MSRRFQVSLRELPTMATRPRTRVTAASLVTITFATLIATARGDDDAKDAANQVDAKADSAQQGEKSPLAQKFGVLLNGPRALAGYNLINPGRKQTYLFDNEGRVVHIWTSEYSSGAAAYLLDNGHLFRPAEAPNRKPGFQGPAAGGRIQEFDWDGNLVWDFEYHSEKRLPHHDAIKLPNGNALLICWERIDEAEAVAQGRRPETVKDSHLQPDCLVEIRPTGSTTGEIVWEWRGWDHLIQDRDRNKPNYGKISDHPERFDVNYIHGEEDQDAAKSDAAKAPAQDAAKDDPSKTAAQDAAKNAPAPPPAAPRKNPDWMHVNALAYNADLDQIVLSSPHFHEIWIIDHGTTKEEAKGHTGGRWGKGGDILYRWGNPRAYRNGTNLDQRLFGQHNIQWIPKGMRGEGHLLVFNNGAGRKPEEYSSVDEFVPPTDKDGNYIRPKRGPFGPAKPLWSYTAPNKKDFYS